MSDTYARSIPPAVWGDLTGSQWKWNPWEPLPYADIDDLIARAPNPADAFGPDEYVRLADGTRATWDGVQWKPYTEVAAAVTGQTTPTPTTSGPPSMANTKAEILDWLDDVFAAGVALGLIDPAADSPHDSSMTKAELLAIVAWLTL